MPRIKIGRFESVQIKSLCDFCKPENLQKAKRSSDNTNGSSLTDDKSLAAEGENSTRLQSEPVTSETRNEEETNALEEENRSNPIEVYVQEPPTPFISTTEMVNRSQPKTTESSYKNQWNPLKITVPKAPSLETSLQTCLPNDNRVKSSQELDQEKFKKFPKFKARPFNKKIFESRGDLGIFCATKRHVTKPQEFHLATNDRNSPAEAVIGLFDMLSLKSGPCHDHQSSRITKPNPFDLYTEKRGTDKKRKFVVEVLKKQYEEERERIPKARLYPLTTDYPVMPPKPKVKQCTKPEPFHLESLKRHEEKIKWEMEERLKMEKQEAEMRIFKAKPILREDPLPVPPKKERKPLTQIEEFSLRVDNRVVERAEFDKMIKEKEIRHKRYKEERESAKMMEEEKALEQLRRTMVPHAREMPKFDNPFYPQKSSKETTKPTSPNLRVAQRKEKRGMDGNITAADMR